MHSFSGTQVMSAACISPRIWPCCFEQNLKILKWNRTLFIKSERGCKMAIHFIKGLIKKSLVFGSILTCADATVQLIERRKHNLKSELNWKSLRRHGMVGSCVIGPLLYSYYFILDRQLPGSSTRTVLKKIACDCVCLNMVYYFLFYYSLSFLEHKNHERAKVIY